MKLKEFLVVALLCERIKAPKCHPWTVSQSDTYTQYKHLCCDDATAFTKCAIDTTCVSTVNGGGNNCDASGAKDCNNNGKCVNRRDPLPKD